MFELTISHVIVFLFDVLPWLHQFCHLVAVEDLFLVLGTGGLLPLVLYLALALAFAVLFLHLAWPFAVI